MFIAELSLACCWSRYFGSAACKASPLSLIIPQVQEEHCQNPYVPLPFQPGRKSGMVGREGREGREGRGGAEHIPKKQFPSLFFFCAEFVRRGNQVRIN